MAIDCWARRTRMPRASLSLPGTVPTCQMRYEDAAGLGGTSVSIESSEMESKRKRSLLLLLRRRPTTSHNHTQLLRLSPSVNDSRKILFFAFELIAGSTNTAKIAQQPQKLCWSPIGNIYNWFQRKCSACLTLATAYDRSFTMHWSHISLPFGFGQKVLVAKPKTLAILRAIRYRKWQIFQSNRTANSALCNVNYEASSQITFFARQSSPTPNQLLRSVKTAKVEKQRKV